jgi:hypothetical protein
MQRGLLKASVRRRFGRERIRGGQHRGTHIAAQDRKRDRSTAPASDAVVRSGVENSR